MCGSSRHASRKWPATLKAPPVNWWLPARFSLTRRAILGRQCRKSKMPVVHAINSFGIIDLPVARGLAPVRLRSSRQFGSRGLSDYPRLLILGPLRDPAGQAPSPQKLPGAAGNLLIQFVQRILQFLAGIGEFVFAFVDLVGIAFFHGLVEISLTRADFMLGVEHLVFAFLLQGGVGAVGGDFAQGGLQAGLLIGFAAAFGLFDLVDDALFLGRAAGQFRDFFSSHQWSGQHAAKGRSEERRVGKECRSRWSPYH